MSAARGRRAAAIVAVVAVLVVVVVVLVGRVQSRPLVVLAGDSITELNAGALAGSVDGTFGIGGHDVAVVARSGATAAAMEPDVVATAADEPRQVVINLGTNDVVRTRDVAGALASIERMAAAFPSAACVHLVTLSESMVSFEDAAGPGPRAAELNQAIIELAAQHGYRLIRWDELVAAGAARSEPLTVDSIHPDGVGVDELAEAYRTAIESC